MGKNNPLSEAEAEVFELLNSLIETKEDKNEVVNPVKEDSKNKSNI